MFLGAKAPFRFKICLFGECYLKWKEISFRNSVLCTEKRITKPIQAKIKLLKSCLDLSNTKWYYFSITKHTVLKQYSFSISLITMFKLKELSSLNVFIEMKLFQLRGRGHTQNNAMTNFFPDSKCSL